ncbi:MAG: imidazole glycerol phosphate synthase subunit HisH [Bacteroidota bacterium]
MIGIVQYRAGNLASVSNALDRLEVPYRISDDPEVLEECQAILFPGVGHAGSAMDDLRRRGLDQWLRETTKPLLGICLGMQLLYESSEEGETETLGLLPGRLQRFDSTDRKVPHMGWNQIHTLADHPLLEGIKEREYFYFVHSYYAPVTNQTLARSDYDGDFAAIAGEGRVTGVQFHPEKSSGAGLRLLRNFVKWSHTFG